MEQAHGSRSSGNGSESKTAENKKRSGRNSNRVSSSAAKKQERKRSDEEDMVMASIDKLVNSFENSQALSKPPTKKSEMEKDWSKIREAETERETAIEKERKRQRVGEGVREETSETKETREKRNREDKRNKAQKIGLILEENEDSQMLSKEVRTSVGSDVEEGEIVDDEADSQNQSNAGRMKRNIVSLFGVDELYCAAEDAELMSLRRTLRASVHEKKGHQVAHSIHDPPATQKAEIRHHSQQPDTTGNSVSSS